MNTIVRNILLVVVCFVLGFVGGCRAVYGFCKDGETAFSMAGRAIRPFAEKQDEADAKKREEDLHGKLSRAEQEIVEAHLRAERFANRDPMRAAEK